jgi:Protein of unknown function (DUF1688)
MVRDWASVFSGERRVLGLPGGDVWPHLWAGSAAPAAASGVDHSSAGWVPLHELAQWLSFSLLAPLADAGVALGDDHVLSALPAPWATRWLLDAGVIVPRQAADLQREWQDRDEWIIESRALTVHAMGELLAQVQQLRPPGSPWPRLSQVLAWGCEPVASRALAAADSRKMPALRPRSGLGF